MDSILFILMLFCLLLVAAWYAGNELRGAKGEWGLLAVLAEFADRAAGPLYRVKERGAPLTRRKGAHDSAPEARAYRAPAEKRARRFRDKNDPAYRARGPLPAYGERHGPQPESPKDRQD